MSGAIPISWASARLDLHSGAEPRHQIVASAMARRAPWSAHRASFRAFLLLPSLDPCASRVIGGFRVRLAEIEYASAKRVRRTGKTQAIALDRCLADIDASSKGRARRGGLTARTHTRGLRGCLGSAARSSAESKAISVLECAQRTEQIALFEAHASQRAVMTRSP